ncbi:unnamed protein product [Protopolystoma xenopodis]|uniref:Uncharacterized protein n=1 Tax=Protopolystoma xenopodis TaxID=117903 RepID=A0A448WSI3_9PLAT|nr:unnamed protein product [Protopolystoma xenopodis]
MLHQIAWLSNQCRNKSFCELTVPKTLIDEREATKTIAKEEDVAEAGVNENAVHNKSDYEEDDENSANAESSKQNDSSLLKHEEASSSIHQPDWEKYHVKYPPFVETGLARQLTELACLPESEI